MDDEIAIVGQNPLGVVDSFDTDSPLAPFLEPLLDFLGNRLDLTRVGAGGDDKIIRKGCHLAQIEHANFGTLS